MPCAASLAHNASAAARSTARIRSSRLQYTEPASSGTVRASTVVGASRNSSQTTSTSNADFSSIAAAGRLAAVPGRSEEHTSEIQSLMHTSYAVFCLKKKHVNPKVLL